MSGQQPACGPHQDRHCVPQDQLEACGKTYHRAAHSQVWVCGNGTILMPIFRYGCVGVGPF